MERRAWLHRAAYFGRRAGNRGAQALVWHGMAGCRARSRVHSRNASAFSAWAPELCSLVPEPVWRGCLSFCRQLPDWSTACSQRTDASCQSAKGTHAQLSCRLRMACAAAAAAAAAAEPPSCWPLLLLLLLLLGACAGPVAPGSVEGEGEGPPAPRRGAGPGRESAAAHGGTASPPADTSCAGLPRPSQGAGSSAPGLPARSCTAAWLPISGSTAESAALVPAGAAHGLL